jgi:hypothetical protein
MFGLSFPQMLRKLNPNALLGADASWRFREED